MSERQVAKNLQLDETAGRSTAHMQLQDTGKSTDSRWELHDDPGLSNWQPVEYARPNQTEPSWILPSVVGLVLIGVAGYMVYIGLNRLSTLDIASVPAETTPLTESNDVTAADAGAPVVAAVEQEATNTPAPTNEPTVTVVPTEEPTLEPTAVLVEQQIATIANQFGVNARVEPSTTSEVLRILEEGETVVILDEQESDEIDGNWLQVRTSEDAIVWISSQFVDIEIQVVPEEPGSAANAVPELDVRVTISSPAGLNAWEEPDSASEIVALLPDDTSYPAVSQSADGQWIEVALEDGSTAWIFLQLVIPDADLGTLPIFQAQGSRNITANEATPTDAEALSTARVTEVATARATAVADTSDSTAGTSEESAAVNTTPTVASDAASGSADQAATDEAATTETISNTISVDEGTEGTASDIQIDTGEAVTITNQFGVNARSTTSTDGEILLVLETESIIPLRGRNEDGSWLQVILDDGRLAWVFAQAVDAPADIESLPIYAPPAVGAPAETLEDTTPADNGGVETGDAGVENASTGDSASENSGASSDAAISTSAQITDSGVLTATVTSFLGAGARPAPTTEEEAIEMVPLNTVLTIIGRSDDNEWIQVELFADQLAWLLVNKVKLSVPLEDIPVVE